MFMVTGFLAWWRATKWAIRAAGLNCPACDDPLVGGAAGSSHGTPGHRHMPLVPWRRLELSKDALSARC
jgi:hypothetical protein